MARLNVSDVPEMMPGAKPGSNPGERWGFEQRCKQLHEAAVEEETQQVQHTRAASGATATGDELVAMFPSLDASLVRCLAAEARTPQAAIETLLALAAATGDPGAPGEERPRATTPPPRDLGTSNMDLFPSLTDSSGWQLPSRRGYELDTEVDDKTDWRDRAKDAAEKPGPAWGPRKPVVAPRKKKGDKVADAEGVDVSFRGPDDYELRQQQGQRRAKNLAQYGRGRGGRNGGRGSRTLDETKAESDQDLSADEGGNLQDEDAAVAVVAS